MMRFAGILAILCAASSALGQEDVLGYDGFDSVVFSDGIRARVEVGDSFKITTQSIEREGYSWSFRQDGVVLHVGLDKLDDGRLLDFSDRFSVRVTVPALAEAKATSGTHMTVILEENEALSIVATSGANVWVREVEGGTVALRAEMGSSIEVIGECTILTAEARAGAFIDADTLECLDVTGMATEGASLRYFAEETARVEARAGARIVGMGEGEVTAATITSGSSFSVR